MSADRDGPGAEPPSGSEPPSGAEPPSGEGSQPRVEPAGGEGSQVEPRRDPARGGSGPPGGRIFSLEGRAAPGLYLAAWLLALGGAALWFVAALSGGPAGIVLVTLGAGAFGFGLAAAAGYQVVERRGRDPARYRGPSPLLVFGVVLAWVSALSALLLRSGLIDPTSPFGFLVVLLMGAAGYALVVWLFAVRSGALTWREMGWPAPDAVAPGGAAVRGTLRGIGVAVGVMLPATFAVLIVGGLLARLLGVEPHQVVPQPGSPGEALAVVLAAALVAPVGEELFFRGFALTAWLRDVGARAAIVRTAVFFAIVHVVNISATSFREGASQALLQTLVILPVGLVLGWLFVRHGIAGAIGGHVTYNTLLLAILLASWLAPASS